MGGQIDPPPHVSWFSSTPAEIGLRNQKKLGPVIWLLDTNTNKQTSIKSNIKYIYRFKFSIFLFKSINPASEDLSTQSESLLKNYNEESDLQGSSRRPSSRRSAESQPGPSAIRDITTRLDNTMDDSLYYVKPNLSDSGNQKTRTLLLEISNFVNLVKNLAWLQS